MALVIRAFLVILSFIKYGIEAGFARLIVSAVAYKTFVTVFFGLILPIVMVVAQIKVSGYVVRYVMDYMSNHIDMGVFPAAIQLTGVSAYLYDALGLGQAFALVITACTIRFAFSFVVKR